MGKKRVKVESEVVYGCFGRWLKGEIGEFANEIDIPRPSFGCLARMISLGCVAVAGSGYSLANSLISD